jgi:hypothetical protein
VKGGRGIRCKQLLYILKERRGSTRSHSAVELALEKAMDLSYDRLQTEYKHICCHDTSNNAVGCSYINVSDNCVVSTVFSETVKRNNSHKECVNQAYLRGIKITGCRREKMADDTKRKTWL